MTSLQLFKSLADCLNNTKDCHGHGHCVPSPANSSLYSCACWIVYMASTNCEFDVYSVLGITPAIVYTILTLVWFHISIATIRQIIQDASPYCQELVPLLGICCKNTIVISAILRGMACGAMAYHSYVAHITDSYFLYEEIIFNSGVIFGVLTYILVLPFQGW